MFQRENFEVHLETDKLNHEKAKLNILNQMKNFQNTLGNSNNANTDKLNHETAELNNFFQTSYTDRLNH